MERSIGETPRPCIKSLIASPSQARDSINRIARATTVLPMLLPSGNVRLLKFSLRRAIRKPFRHCITLICSYIFEYTLRKVQIAIHIDLFGYCICAFYGIFLCDDHSGICLSRIIHRQRRRVRREVKTDNVVTRASPRKVIRAGCTQPGLWELL